MQKGIPRGSVAVKKYRVLNPDGTEDSGNYVSRADAERIQAKFVQGGSVEEYDGYIWKEYYNKMNHKAQLTPVPVTL